MAKRHNINTTDKILIWLLSHKKEEFTIRALAQKIAVDYKTVYMGMESLIRSNLVHARKVGQTVLCSLNLKEFTADIFRAELQRREERLKNKDLAVMHSYFKDIAEPFFILLLFGSYASGKPRTGSDVDLLLIADDEKIKKEVRGKIAIIPLPIHLLDFHSREFVSMLKTTEFNVGQEAFYNNVILYGIEDYYRLIHHA